MSDLEQEIMEAAREMEACGFVEIKPNPDDPDNDLIKLTEKGKNAAPGEIADTCAAYRESKGREN